MTWRPPDRLPVLGVPISTTSYDEVLELIAARPDDRATTYAFCNVHAVMTARRSPELRRALERFDVTTSDGVPLVWTLRRLGAPDQTRVYGPDLMELALPYGLERGWTHYLYGATEETLDRLVDAAARLAPGVRIVGRHAPPFRPMTAAEEAVDVARIRDSGADCVWVGLGLPKQELWVDRNRDRLPGQAVLAVGAAFDLLAGTVPQAPDWLQDRGLEWAYRLAQEPRRLWRRYLWNNPAYAVLATAQVLRHRRVGR